jgi:hypothetical protein
MGRPRIPFDNQMGVTLDSKSMEVDMAYEKAQVQALAQALFNMGVAFSDGVQLSEDSDEMLAVVPAAIGAADEFTADLASTLMYLGSKLLELGADLKRAQAGP